MKDYIMRKKDLALEVIKRLEKEYPDADCTLDYNDAWKLLISVRLAAQCTDCLLYTSHLCCPCNYHNVPHTEPDLK